MILLLVPITKRTGQYFFFFHGVCLKALDPSPTELPAKYLKILVLQLVVLSSAQALLTHVDTTTFLCSQCSLFPRVPLTGLRNLTSCLRLHS